MTMTFVYGTAVDLHIRGLGVLNGVVLGGPTAFEDYFIQITEPDHPLFHWVIMAKPEFFQVRRKMDLRVVPKNDNPDQST